MMTEYVAYKQLKDALPGISPDDLITLLSAHGHIANAEAAGAIQFTSDERRQAVIAATEAYEIAVCEEQSMLFHCEIVLQPIESLESDFFEPLTMQVWFDAAVDAPGYWASARIDKAGLPNAPTFHADVQSIVALASMLRVDAFIIDAPAHLIGARFAELLAAMREQQAARRVYASFGTIA